MVKNERNEAVHKMSNTEAKFDELQVVKGIYFTLKIYLVMILLWESMGAKSGPR